MSDLKNTLRAEFEDAEYAHAYMHQHLLEKFAAQLYTLRTARDLSQGQLAELSGVPQGKISRLETADVESFTVTTMMKLAKALDVAVRLGFEGFSSFVRDVEKTSPQQLAVPSREEDLAVMDSMSALTEGPLRWNLSAIPANDGRMVQRTTAAVIDLSTREPIAA